MYPLGTGSGSVTIEKCFHGRLETLVDEGFVIKTVGEYDLSLKTVDLGGHGSERKNEYKVAKNTWTNWRGNASNGLIRRRRKWLGRYLYQKVERVHEFPTQSGSRLTTVAGMRASRTSRKGLETKSLPNAVFLRIRTGRPLIETDYSMSLNLFAQRILRSIYSNVGIQCVAKQIRTGDSVILGAVSTSMQSETVTEDQF